MIPEVTERQVLLMQTVTYDPNMSVFSQCGIKEDDSFSIKINVEQANVDAEHLCTLGFLKNITDGHREQINKVEKDTGRTWKVYEITAMGRAMFQITTSATVN